MALGHQNSENAQNIGVWLRRHAALDGDKTAIQFEDDEPISYRRLSRWVDCAAVRLRTDYGLGPGDRIAYIGLNDPAMLVLLFACARIGAMMVTVNWRLASAEIDYIVSDCTPKAVFYGPEFADVSEASAGNTGAHASAISIVEGWQSDTVSFDDTGTLNDPLLIVYTSGTTGRPKGAILSQRALFVNALNSLDMHEMRRSDRVLILLPLFHVGGLNILLTPALYAGATVYLHAKFDPEHALTSIERQRPSLLVLVPAMMTAMMALPRWNSADFSSLRCLTTGSSVLPVELIGAFEDHGISVIQVYGSSETCPIAAYQRPGEGATNPRSTGKTALHTRIRLVGRDEQVVSEPDIDGEIEVRGGHVMSGYWNNEEATRSSFRDGWFRTGDIGRMDSDGFLYFQERRTNLIVSGGENIYPAEIERVIQALDNVREVSVVGMPDPKWGAVPVAVIAVEKDGPGEAEIRSELESQLARYKLPRTIVFVEDLPRNAMGKVVAGAVKKMLLDDHSISC